MTESRRRFTGEFKARVAVAAMREDRTLASEFGVRGTSIRSIRFVGPLVLPAGRW